MKYNTAKSYQPSGLIQAVVNFIIPIIILVRFSDDSKLGPTKGLLIALAFPIIFEIYFVFKRKKLSMFSIIAIAGIIITGAISLLGLSEGWLAIRRSITYIIISIALTISVLIKRPILNALLPQFLDLEKITDHAQKKRNLTLLKRNITLTSYFLSGLLLIIGIASYLLTVAVFKSEAGTTAFNQEYARLRVLSLPIITLPMFVGIMIITIRLMLSIEKLTGLSIDGVIRKKPQQKKY